MSDTSLRHFHVLLYEIKYISDFLRLLPDLVVASKCLMGLQRVLRTVNLINLINFKLIKVRKIIMMKNNNV